MKGEKEGDRGGGQYLDGMVELDSLVVGTAGEHSSMVVLERVGCHGDCQGSYLQVRQGGDRVRHKSVEDPYVLLCPIF